MPWGMYTFTSQIISLLERNNTTTASIDISGGLERRVQLIRRGKVNVTPIPNTQYPAILVRINNKDGDEFDHLGACNHKRDQYANAQIVPVTMNGTHLDAEGENYRLASNIEALLRSKISLSGTVNDALISGVDYDAEPIEDEFHNVFAVIEVRAHNLSD